MFFTNTIQHLFLVLHCLALVCFVFCVFCCCVCVFRVCLYFLILHQTRGLVCFIVVCVKICVFCFVLFCVPCMCVCMCFFLCVCPVSESVCNACIVPYHTLLALFCLVCVRVRVRMCFFPSLSVLQQIWRPANVRIHNNDHFMRHISLKKQSDIVVLVPVMMS